MPPRDEAEEERDSQIRQDRVVMTDRYPTQDRNEHTH
jgi:hypothetical protein